MSEELNRAVEAATRIDKMASDCLTPLILAMSSNDWRPEFRAIVLRAVAQKAMRLANEVENASAT